MAGKTDHAQGYQVSNEKIYAFREFAQTLCAQVVEQLCAEFERESRVMFDDLVQYRNELERVAELLGHQLGRERQLHDLLDSMSGHSSNIAAHVLNVAQQSPSNSSHIHQTLDDNAAQNRQVVDSLMRGMQMSNSVAQQHLQQVQALHEPRINAENEFNRICKLLEEPMLSTATPAATTAVLPNISQPWLRQVPSSRPYTPPRSISPYSAANNVTTQPLPSPMAISSRIPTAVGGGYIAQGLGQQRFLGSTAQANGFPPQRYL